MSYTPEQWAAKESALLEARERLESRGVYPSLSNLAMEMNIGESTVGAVRTRLKARDLWPPSPLPAPRGGHAAATRASAEKARARAEAQAGIRRVDIRAACRAIQRSWSSDMELSRRTGSHGHVPARVPGSRADVERLVI